MVSRREEPKNRTIGFCWESDKSLTHRIHGTCMFTVYLHLFTWMLYHTWILCEYDSFSLKRYVLHQYPYWIENQNICISVNDLWMTHEWSMNIHIYYIYIYWNKDSLPWFPIKITPQLMMLPSVPSSKVAFALCGAREVALSIGVDMILNGWNSCSKLMRWKTLVVHMC